MQKDTKRQQRDAMVKYLLSVRRISFDNFIVLVENIFYVNMYNQPKG